MSVGSEAERTWVLASGERYWPGRAKEIAALPLSQAGWSEEGDLQLTRVALPEWAADIAVDGSLVALAGSVAPRDGETWMRCNWLATAFHFLAGTLERAYEVRHGPALSYAFRLPVHLSPLFDRAWVNRIFLFLRRWAARQHGRPEAEMFGPLPLPSIIITHDVDAIRLTPEIRLKQTLFQLVHAGRSLIGGCMPASGGQLAAALRFAGTRGDLRTLARVRQMEQHAGLRSIFHFYGGPGGLARRSPRRLLLDPAYDIADAYLRDEVRRLRDGGWIIGVHPSFEAWSSAERMIREKRRVEEVAGKDIVHCRQHWLRFSWSTTWRAQQEAGFRRDSTLGFNDRPGFRGGHALSFRPFDLDTRKPMDITAVPMLFMDSHFYGSPPLSRSEVRQQMKDWINEVVAVRGEVTVNWHTHTITHAYGWGGGFEDLLDLLAR